MRNAQKLAVITMVLGLMTTGMLQAQEPTPAPVARFFLGMGLTHGGEELAEVRVKYDNWGSSDEEIHSGDLVTFTAGGIIPLPVPAFSVQASVGYHIDSVSADDDEVYFARVPLELIAFYNFDHHRVGAGFSHHLDPELDLKDAGGPRVEFDDATGALVQYDYSFAGWNSNGFLVGIRYMWIDYDIDEIDGTRVNGSEIDGNHFGVHFSYMF